MSIRSVMIVDDNAMDRYIFKRYLEETTLDCYVFEEENGELAEQFFLDYADNSKKHPELYPPCVIFLDINMPLVGGFEFLERFSRLKRRVDLDSIVIMMFTSSGRQEDKDKAFAYDFVKDYIVKSELDSDVLEEKISKYSLVN